MGIRGEGGQGDKVAEGARQVAGRKSQVAINSPYPTPYTPHPTPYTPHPTPYTLHPTHPTSHTPHPHPTPHTHTPPTMATILAIETSCDETAVAIVKNRQVCSSVVNSQILVHSQYGELYQRLLRASI
ncbi:MAG: tRNA N6-adenosine threonylcarbamoyltransferase, mitochondrial [Chroococcidiopsis cubana SAG 39.79]|nr:hypothetical protein [Chroococcidiopsis cubana]MDZ4874728.1 tRNA N6-adenosine threonylcarbamoyltransferase, mitochondrial [Chroococcidiopsis cubana SAG 39.79]